MLLAFLCCVLLSSAHSEVHLLGFDTTIESSGDVELSKVKLTEPPLNSKRPSMDEVSTKKTMFVGMDSIPHVSAHEKMDSMLPADNQKMPHVFSREGPSSVHHPGAVDTRNLSHAGLQGSQIPHREIHEHPQMPAVMGNGNQSATQGQRGSPNVPHMESIVNRNTSMPGRPDLPHVEPNHPLQPGMEANPKTAVKDAHMENPKLSGMPANPDVHAMTGENGHPLMPGAEHGKPHMPSAESDHGKLHKPGAESDHGKPHKPGGESDHGKLPKPGAESAHGKPHMPGVETNHGKPHMPGIETDHGEPHKPVAESDHGKPHMPGAEKDRGKSLAIEKDERGKLPVSGDVHKMPDSKSAMDKHLIPGYKDHMHMPEHVPGGMLPHEKGMGEGVPLPKGMKLPHDGSHDKHAFPVGIENPTRPPVHMNGPHMPSPVDRVRDHDDKLSRMGVESADLPRVKVDDFTHPPQPGMMPGEHSHNLPKLPQEKGYENRSHLQIGEPDAPTLPNLNVQSSVLYLSNETSPANLDDNATMDEDMSNYTTGRGPSFTTLVKETTTEIPTTRDMPPAKPHDLFPPIKPVVVTTEETTTTTATTTPLPTTSTTRSTTTINPTTTTRRTTTTTKSTTKKATTTTPVPIVPKFPPSMESNVPCEFIEKDFMCNVDISCFGEGEVDCTMLEDSHQNVEPERMATAEPDEYEEESATIGFFPPELVGRASSKKHLPLLLATLAAMQSNNESGEFYDTTFSPEIFKLITTTTGAPKIKFELTTTTTTMSPSTTTTIRTTPINDKDINTTSPPTTEMNGNSTLNGDLTTMGYGNDTAGNQTEKQPVQNVHIPAPLKAIASVKLEEELKKEREVREDAKKGLRRKRDTMAIESSMPSESLQLALERADRGVKTCKITGNLQCNIVPTTGLCTGKGTCKVISIEKSEKSTSEKGVENWAIAVIAICATAAGLTIILLVYLVVTSKMKGGGKPTPRSASVEMGVLQNFRQVEETEGSASEWSHHANIRQQHPTVNKNAPRTHRSTTCETKMHCDKKTYFLKGQIDVPIT